MVLAKYRNIINKLNTYIPGKPIDEVKKELGLSKVIKLASNENPLGPSPKTIIAIKNNAKQVSVYPDGGCTDLKKELSHFHSVKPENLILGNGSDELIFLLALAYIDSGDEIIISEQTFSEYAFAANCLEGNIIKIPQKEYKYDLTEFKKQITSKTKIIYLCNPNNPTGTMYNKKTFDNFMSDLPENILVFIDEAYYEYVEASDFPDGLTYFKKYKNIIVSRTFSKIYGLAGLRIGYAIADETIINTLNKVREPFNVNLIAQKAAIAALQDQKHLNKVKRINNKALELIYKTCSNLKLEYVKSTTNFVLIKTPKSAKELFNTLLKKGFIIRAMDGFGLPDHIRVSTGTISQTKKFLKTLEQVLKG